MADVFTKAKRAEVMSHIRGSDTKPERLVRSILHNMGYRFRLHRTDLPGKPDIVLPRFRVVIFVHGCFWHRHKDCQFAYTPKSRKEFWLEKLESNVVRDRQVKVDLKKLEWHIITIWECELRSLDRVKRNLKTTLSRYH